MIAGDGIKQSSKHCQRPGAAQPWVRAVEIHLAPRDQNLIAPIRDLFALLISHVGADSNSSISSRKISIQRARTILSLIEMRHIGISRSRTLTSRQARSF